MSQQNAIFSAIIPDEKAVASTVVACGERREERKND